MLVFLYGNEVLTQLNEIALWISILWFVTAGVQCLYWSRSGIFLRYASQSIYSLVAFSFLLGANIISNVENKSLVMFALQISLISLAVGLGLHYLQTRKQKLWISEVLKAWTTDLSRNYLGWALLLFL